MYACIAIEIFFLTANKHFKLLLPHVHKILLYRFMLNGELLGEVVIAVLYPELYTAADQSEPRTGTNRLVTLSFNSPHRHSTNSK